jgi:hypothetical protein
MRSKAAGQPGIPLGSATALDRLRREGHLTCWSERPVVTVQFRVYDQAARADARYLARTCSEVRAQRDNTETVD